MRGIALLYCLAGPSVSIVAHAAEPNRASAADQYVTVLGKAAAPCKVAWTPELTALGAIRACGIIGWNITKTALIKRGDTEIAIPLLAMHQGQEPDVKLQAGDILVLPKIPFRTTPARRPKVQR